MSGKIQTWLVCVKCGYKVLKGKIPQYQKKCPKCGEKLKEKVVVLK